MLGALRVVARGALQEEQWLLASNSAKCNELVASMVHGLQ